MTFNAASRLRSLEDRSAALGSSRCELPGMHSVPKSAVLPYASGVGGLSRRLLNICIYILSISLYIYMYMDMYIHIYICMYLYIHNFLLFTVLQMRYCNAWPQRRKLSLSLSSHPAFRCGAGSDIPDVSGEVPNRSKYPNQGYLSQTLTQTSYAEVQTIRYCYTYFYPSGFCECCLLVGMTATACWH